MSELFKQGQDTHSVAIHDSTGVDSKTKTKREAISRRKLFDGIISFLSECEPYEAEAICAIVQFAKKKAPARTPMSADEKRKVNNYLNSEFPYYGTLVKLDDVRYHRLERVRKLRDKLREYLLVDIYERVIDTLLDIALGSADVSSMFKACQDSKKPYEPIPGLYNNMPAHTSTNPPQPPTHS